MSGLNYWRHYFAINTPFYVCLKNIVFQIIATTRTLFRWLLKFVCLHAICDGLDVEHESAVSGASYIIFYCWYRCINYYVTIPCFTCKVNGTREKGRGQGRKKCGEHLSDHISYQSCKCKVSVLFYIFVVMSFIIVEYNTEYTPRNGFRPLSVWPTMSKRALTWPNPKHLAAKCWPYHAYIKYAPAE